jgi:quinol monooxygenase YgiN
MDTRHFLLLGAAMLVSGGAPVLAQNTRAPYVRVAEIDIDPAQLDAYKTAVIEQIETAIRLEPGVLAQYCVSDKENPAHITVFEIYADSEAYKAHVETAHFKNYKISTQAMVKSLKLRDVVPILLGAKPR